MRPPILWIAIGFGAGLLAGLVLFPTPGSALSMGCSVLLGAALTGRRATAAAAFGVAIVAGLLWGLGAIRAQAASCAGRWSADQDGGTRAAVVRLQDPVSGDGGIVDAAVLGDRCGGALRLRWPTGHPARGGTVWVVAGRLVRAFGGGVGAPGTLVARRVRVIDPEPSGRGALRDRAVARAEALFGVRAPLVEALVLARRTELDSEIRERYARAGLAHLLAISGMHVGFLAAWLAYGLRRASPRDRFLATGALLVGYLWLLGFPAPATRAAVMVALGGLARLRQRVVTPRATIALAALVVMVVDPWAVVSPGLWLSIAAVGSVIWAARATARSHRVVRMVAPAAVATLCTAPISAFAFGTVAPIGVITNLIAVPLASLVVPGLMLALVLSWIVPSLAALLATGAGFGLALVDVVARGAAAVPGGHVVTVAGWSAAVTWLIVALLAWWLWDSPRRPWLIAARLTFVATIAVWASVFERSSLDACQCLQVHFLDVGQGDAAALRTPGGRWIVIDGGPRTPEADAGRRVVVPFLRRHGAGQVALVVATHGDADHLGGIPAVLNAFPPRLVLEPGQPLGRPLYLEFLADVEGSGAAWHPARAGDHFDVDSVRVDVLSPDSAWMTVPVDVNEHGVVLTVTYHEVRLLFQADAGLPVEGRLAGRVGAIDVLKVGHHGSHTATSDDWLDELRPHDAVISVGAHNKYGHPDPAVVARLLAHGIRVRRTDRDGTVTYETDGQRAHSDFRHHD